MRFITLITATLVAFCTPASATETRGLIGDSPITCSLADGDLHIETAAGAVVLAGDWRFNARRQRYFTDDDFSLVTAAGAFPIPAAGRLQATCDPYFAVNGTVGGPPGLSAAWPDTALAVDGPSLGFGMALRRCGRSTTE